MQNISLKLGDITQAKVDAIVNAANPTLMGGGGVDGAIHKAAGPKLLEECRTIKKVDGIRCPFGEARITGAGNLPAKYIIHTVGPIYRNEAKPEDVLISAYRKSCQLALQYQCQTIAFPAISCGAYGYPLLEAADIAISVCSESAFSSLSIHFYLYNQQLFDIFEQRLNTN